jgi:hypothetical protein
VASYHSPPDDRNLFSAIFPQIEERFSNKMITFAPQINNNKEFMDDYHAENYNL